ncbi:unnamed protein product [Ambrosiozyma monospora]|uniref:Mitochondrial import inner membrane translocase subunit n=1 Tax=Ambrosiozyma monospora TaxID=43982 RepID=A0A9W6SW67_AMBMO|nr:unnamed protein product [Ambrosiozyma monospora]
MSFFGLGGAAPQVSTEQKLKGAEAELDMITTMFNQLVDSCHRKCFDKNYSEGSLTKNESLCVDRCVSKYFDANVQVGNSMQSVGQSGTLGRGLK